MTRDKFIFLESAFCDLIPRGLAVLCSALPSECSDVARCVLSDVAFLACGGPSEHPLVFSRLCVWSAVAFCCAPCSMYSASCSAIFQAVLRLCAHCDGHLLCCRTRVCAWLPLAFWLGAVMVMRVALPFWQGLEGI